MGDAWVSKVGACPRLGLFQLSQISDKRAPFQCEKCIGSERVEPILVNLKKKTNVDFLCVQEVNFFDQTHAVSGQGAGARWGKGGIYKAVCLIQKGRA